LNVRQDGAVYTLDGSDDQCGAGIQAGVVGTAFLNPDGSIGMGLNSALAPGAAPVVLYARLDLATVSGTWNDSAGNSGSFAFTPGPGTGGTARPMPQNGLRPGSVTADQIAAGAIGTTQIAVGSITAAQIALGSITGAQIAAGAVTTQHLAPGAVQLPLAGTCPPGQPPRCQFLRRHPLRARLLLADSLHRCGRSRRGGSRGKRDHIDRRRCRWPARHQPPQ